MTFHWYTGVVPALTAVAVKVSEVPWHTLSADRVIETLTGVVDVRAMVMELDVAGFPEGQLAFEVIMQETWSPAAGV